MYYLIRLNSKQRFVGKVIKKDKNIIILENPYIIIYAESKTSNLKKQAKIGFKNCMSTNTHNNICIISKNTNKIEMYKCSKKTIKTIEQGVVYHENKGGGM